MTLHLEATHNKPVNTLTCTQLLALGVLQYNIQCTVTNTHFFFTQTTYTATKMQYTKHKDTQTQVHTITHSLNKEHYTDTCNTNLTTCTLTKKIPSSTVQNSENKVKKLQFIFQSIHNSHKVRSTSLNLVRVL